MEMKVTLEDHNNLSSLANVDTSKFHKYAIDFPSTILQNLEDRYLKLFKRIDRSKNELRPLYGDEMSWAARQVT